VCNPGTEICDNGIDEQGDGWVDCADADCIGSEACQTETCTDGVDNDGDGDVDCDDSDCSAEQGCVSDSCTAVQTVACDATTTSIQIANSTSGVGVNDWYTCGNAAFGPEYVTAFTSNVSDDVSLTLNYSAGIDLDVIVIEGGSTPGNCEPQSCQSTGYGAIGPDTTFFEAEAGQTYFLVVDGATAADAGAFTLDIECGNTPSVEQCTNGTDDDGDSLVDCADPDCSGAFVCLPAENCVDNIDNDQDNFTDCSDSDCNNAVNCQDEQCTDTVDNDGDGDIDCADPDCAGDAACP